MGERRAGPEVATAAGIGGRASSPARRRVTVDGVVGMLAVRGGRWVLANDLEVRILEALGGSVGARERLLALAATLDAAMIEGSQLRRLARLLDEIAHSMPCLVYVPGELMGAVTYACACWDDPCGGRWIRWALSAQLDPGLVQMGLPGPGLESLTWRGSLSCGGFGRDTHWIGEMPQEFWDRLESRHDDDLADVAAACDPNVSPKRLAELAEAGRGHWELMDLVVSNPRCPKRVLREIGSSPTAGGSLHRRVAQALNASAGVLDELADSLFSQVRATVALNPNTSPRTLQRLAGDADIEVRVAAARNQRMPTAALAVLAADPWQPVRSWAAVHVSTPPQVLEQLLGDRGSLVRACAASNPTTPAGAVAALVADRAITVRRAVAGHVGIDAATLETLAGDSKPTVRLDAAANPGCGEALLGRLATDPDTYVRAEVAGNDTATAAILELLATDVDWWPRSQAASNPATGAGLLAVLAEDSDESVRSMAAANPNTPAEALVVLADDTSDTVRGVVARNPALAEPLLRGLADDEDECVRAAAAENPSLPADVWAVLAGDDSYCVRAAAAAHAPPRRGHGRAGPDGRGGCGL